GAVDQPAMWSWNEFLALPSEELTTDIHCVTKWSKLDTAWRGVAGDVVLENVDTAAHFRLAFCGRGATPHPPPPRLPPGRARGVVGVRRPPTGARARRPRPPARPAPLLLEERKMGSGAPAPRPRRARVLGDQRLPQPRGSLEGTAVLERLEPRRAPLIWRVAT